MGPPILTIKLNKLLNLRADKKVVERGVEESKRRGEREGHTEKDIFPVPPEPEKVTEPSPLPSHVSLVVVAMTCISV